MILSTVSLKGGSGKTTIAVNLAVEFAHQGVKVALVDSDPNNKNTLKWSGIRPANLPTIFTVGLSDAKALRNNAPILASEYDLVIIDGTPALKNLTGTIMMLSDLVILPVQQSAYDLWAFDEEFLPKYQDVLALKPDLDCRILRNATQKTIITREVAKILDDYDIPVLNTMIGRRVAYSTSPLFGKGATEYKDADARFEIAKLGREINEILTGKMKYNVAG